MDSKRINEAFIKWFEKEYNDSWQIYLADGEESHHPMEIHNGYSEGYKQSRIDTLKELEKEIYVEELDIVEIAEYITTEINILDT